MDSGVVRQIALGGAAFWGCSQGKLQSVGHFPWHYFANCYYYCCCLTIWLATTSSPLLPTPYTWARHGHTHLWRRSGSTPCAHCTHFLA